MDELDCSDDRFVTTKQLTFPGDGPEEAGRTEEVLTVHAAIVEMQPTEAMWRRNYADSLIKLGRLDEAAVQLDEAERLDPPAPYLALRRAELAKAHADPSTAAEWA